MPNRYRHFQKEEYPEMYSDSTPTTRAELSLETLGFILSTIAAGNKEHEFEECYREMVRLTVAPNLIPQTGPTGGGDSKVDSETYPVDETLAERLPFSVAETAGDE